MTPVELVRSRLLDPKPNGRGWQARCPAHDDQRPSLSLSEGEDGRALVCCHAGCSAEAIVKAIRLTLRDLMPSSPPKRPPRPAPPHPPSGQRSGSFKSAHDAVAELERQHGPRSTTWTYTTETGEPEGVIVRWDLPDGGKDIRPVSREGSGWKIGGMKAPRPLYRLPELVGATRIYITEGEKAAEAVRSVGLVATTSPHGSLSAASANWSVLAGKDCVLVPDRDFAGATYAATVISILSKLTPRPTVRLLELPDLPAGGDFVEFLEARDCKTSDEIRAEVEALANALEPVHPPEAADSTAGKPLLVNLADVHPTPVRWLWPGRVAIGKITFVAGDPGLGKSFISLDMIARVSTGAGWPDQPGQPTEPAGAVLLSAEDDLADTIRPRLDAAGADTTRIRALQAVKRVDPRTGAEFQDAFSLMSDLAALEQAIKETPDCRLVVVDPISAYLGKADSHKNAEVRAVLAPLAELASKYNVAIVAITHLRKGEGPAMYRSMGSLAFVAAARAVWAVAKDADDPTGQRRLFLPVKNNLARDLSGMAYMLTATASADGHPVVAWEAQPVQISADEALSRAFGAGARNRDDEAPDSALEEASNWLRDMLSQGPVAAKELRKAASDAGHAWATVRRAKKAIGAEAKPDKFGPGSQWQWSMPNATGAQADPTGAHTQDVSASGNDEHLCDDSPGTSPEEPT